jgi:hypothetical protein
MKRQLSLKHIQWIIWIILFTIHTLALLPYDPVGQSMLYSALYLCLYDHHLWQCFFPVACLYEKGHKVLYVGIGDSVDSVVVSTAFYSTFYIYNHFYAEKPVAFRWSSTTSSLITCILVYISAYCFISRLIFLNSNKNRNSYKKNIQNLNSIC